jgi:WD domain, G-beta repeat
VRLWDPATGEEIRAIKKDDGFVRFAAFSVDGARVLTATGERTARLWDSATGEEVRSFQGHTDVVTGVAFSPDGLRVLTQSLDKTARIWDAATGKQVRVFDRPDVNGKSVVVSPDGRRVLDSSLDQTRTRLWDVSTGRDIVSFKGGTAFAFSGDGGRVLTAASDRIVREWDISAIPDGTIFDIACAWLPDHDLSGLGKDQSLDLSGQPPICQKDADGRVAAPLLNPEK